jgi:hypothetical protein
MSARPKTGNIKNTTTERLLLKYINLKEEKNNQNSSYNIFSFEKVSKQNIKTQRSTNIVSPRQSAELITASIINSRKESTISLYQSINRNICFLNPE